MSFYKPTQRFLLPNGVRLPLPPRHGNDTGGSGDVVGSDEERNQIKNKDTPTTLMQAPITSLNVTF